MIGPSQYFAPTLLQCHVARNFKEEVADEKNAGSRTVDGIADSKILLHLQFGKTYVYPVNVSKDVAEEKEGDEAATDAPICTLFEFGCELCVSH